ncbi:MAG: DNA polymerase III subunit epsilon [Candidatus Dasytiphilus stammeri]
MKRQIILDIETTGMNYNGPPYEGHRIIEIGAIEIVDRCFTGNNFHVYLNPNRPVDPLAMRIHGITDEELLNKPQFIQIADNFLTYIEGHELVIHNASFDISFLNYELSLLNDSYPRIETICTVNDSLVLARKIFPGQRNSLDSLCSRLKIENKRVLPQGKKIHGALVDAQILAEVYLAMSSVGQSSLLFIPRDQFTLNKKEIIESLNSVTLPVIKANNEEITAHVKYLQNMKDKNGICIWNNTTAKDE